MIHVLATIEVTPGKRDTLLEEMKKIVPLVQAEEGCIEYGPAIDVETNLGILTAVRENEVMVIEKWTSLETLTRHLGAPHMIEYRTRVRGLVQRVGLRILEPAP